MNERTVWTSRFGLVLLITLTAALPARAQTDVDAQVESLLGRMTLEEKVGQMTQLTLQAVSAVEETATQAHALDPARLREAVVDRNVGSILNVWNVAFTPEHWTEVITAIQDLATKETRLGIPVLYGIDAVHGHQYMVNGTIFPQNLALAATWNPELVYRSNEITAAESRASGIPWNFSPVLDLGRHPLWSRFFETFGEDVHLTSVLGRAAVEGQQAAGRVAATGKHFVGYSLPLSGKDRTPAWIPDRFLREYFLPPFEAAMDAGLKTIMVNSGEVNGVAVHASREILTDLLRGEMGFEGVVVTDWEDIIRLHSVHRVAETQKEAVRLAVLAGVDMSMVPYDLSFYDHLLALAKEGAVSEERIDESVRRILKLKYDLGLFDDAYPDQAALAEAGSPASHAVSRAAAEEAITLLKNENGRLPLAKTTRVLVTGPGATSLPALHGSWTYSWQGTDEALYPEETKTILEALQAEIGSDRVVHVPGAGFDEVIDLDAAAAAARGVDVVVVALAEVPSVEKPGDIEDLMLPEAQQRLVEAVAATGTPVVLALVQNRPRIVRAAESLADAVVAVYQTGPYGGEALADVLFGDVNPSGRLPFTYPRYTGSIVPYDHKNAERADLRFGWEAFNPQWPFGHGLSYTTFAYSDLVVEDAVLGEGDVLRVSVTVENTGERAGKEVVQLYVSDLYASITPSVERLRAFEKISLEPGASQRVTFEVPVRSLAFVGLDDTWVVEPGGFEVRVGSLKQGFEVE